MTRRRWLLALAVVLAPALVAPRLAAAQCTTTTLSSTVPVTTGTGDQDFQFTQSNNYWTAVGVRASSSSADWDLYVYGGTTSYPTCLTGLLGSSARGAGVADVVVGDFNSNAPGTYYARAHHFSSDNSTATVQWDDGPDIMPVNGPLNLLTFAGTDVVKCWDIFLVQGQTYHVSYYANTSLKVLLFQNPANSTYWTGRAGAQWELGASSAGLDYTAPATDWYGLVLVNDDGSNAQYWLQVDTCSPVNTLASRTPVQTSDGVDYYTFTPTTSLWTAVGTRPVSGAGEQDMRVYAGPGAAAPGCFNGWQNESDYGGGSTNFDVGQWTAGTPMYGSSTYGSFTGAPAGNTTEWDGDGRILYVDDPHPTVVSVASNDVLDCWNVWMEAGKTYTIYSQSTAGLYEQENVYENPGSGTYWAAAANYIFQSNGQVNPTTTGWHALVESHSGTGTGTYTLQVVRCETPTVLANDVPVHTVEPTGYYSFNQQDEFWTALGVHSMSSSVDWDLEATGSSTGSDPPECFSNTLTNSSYGAGSTDFVVGDFNVFGNAFGTYYLHPYRYNGDADAWTEWDSGADVLSVGDPLTHVALSDSDFLRCWDVFLNAGQNYTLIFEHDPSLNANVYVFQSNNAPYWAGRPSAMYHNYASGSFTASNSDWYGVVVANDGGSGGADLRFLPPNVGVPPPGTPQVTALLDAGPNPNRGPLTVAFDLAAGASVAFELIDVAGRVVSSRPAEPLDAGSWSRSWDPFVAAVGPGVYFLRMRVDGREIGERKIARLE